MSMKSYERISEMLCSELDEFAGKNSMSKGDLENVHLLTDTIKNIKKIEMLEEGKDSSQDGSWTAQGNYSRRRMSRDGMSRRDSYADGSYANDSYADWYIGEGGSGRSMAASIEDRMRDPNLSREEKETLRRAKSILM